MAGIWPEDIRCVVTLGFDIDGVTSWLNRNPAFANRPTLMSMAEYGPKRGVHRILKLLDDYDIKASFYVPGYVAENYPEMVKDLVKRGHEVGHHGYIHEPPGTMDLEEEVEVLEKGISVLESITGERPRGYRAPRFDPSSHTLSLLAAHDFVYDTSLMDDDAPYTHRVDGKKLVEIPVKWSLDDFAYFACVPQANVYTAMHDPDSVFDSYASEFDGVYKYGRCMTLTMHPQITGRPSRLSTLERLIRHARSYPDVAFMRGIDIAEYWLSRDG